MLHLQGKDTQKQKKMGKSLTEALKLVLLIGLVAMVFGPSYSYSYQIVVWSQVE